MDENIRKRLNTAVDGELQKLLEVGLAPEQRKRDLEAAVEWMGRLLTSLEEPLRAQANDVWLSTFKTLLADPAIAFDATHLHIAAACADHSVALWYARVTGNTSFVDCSVFNK